MPNLSVREQATNLTQYRTEEAINLSKVSFGEQPRAQSTRRKTSYDTCTRRNQKPIQAPPKFNGKSSWETFQAQFHIAASINGWYEGDKAAFLATSLEGKAALVLNNMSNDDRRYYRLLVAALAVWLRGSERPTSPSWLELS